MKTMGSKRIYFPELVEKTGLPEQTLRRYVREFARWIPTKKVGRQITFQPEAVDTVLVIRAAYGEGKATADIHALLSVTVAAVIDADVEPVPGAMATADQLARVEGVMERLVVAMERQADALEAVLARLSALEGGKDARNLAVEPSQDQKRVDAPGEDETPRKKPFWKRWFRGES